MYFFLGKKTKARNEGKKFSSKKNFWTSEYLLEKKIA